MRTKKSDICAGMRQECVLSPRFFCSALQLAMGRWQNQVEHFGLNWGDRMSHGMSHSLDLRLADDIFLFRESAQETNGLAAGYQRATWAIDIDNKI